jgi:hypothetical protein
MPPTGFLIFFAFCAGWAANSAFRILRGDEVSIAGRKASRSVTAAALVIILVAVGLFAATQLGFITDHAP